VHERHIAVQHIGGHHSGKVHRVLGAAKRGCVAQLRFLQIVDGRTHLEQGGKRADPLVDVVLAEGLRAQQPSIGFPDSTFMAIGLAPG